MKSSIIFLGLLALSFTSTNAANEFKSENLDQYEFATLKVENNQQESQMVFADTSSIKIESDTDIFNPSLVIKTVYAKTTEEIIAENKLITESTEAITQPFPIDFAFENRIAEDNQIIESTISNVAYPLDYDKINHNLKKFKVRHNDAITADIKL